MAMLMSCSNLNLYAIQFILFNLLISYSNGVSASLLAFGKLNNISSLPIIKHKYHSIVNWNTTENSELIQ